MTWSWSPSRSWRPPASTCCRGRCPGAGCQGFYQQVAGGLLATLFAVGTAATDLRVDPSMVVTASIIMLLAGIGFMGAIQDALTGFYITAGVSGGLTVGTMLGVELGRLDPGAAGLHGLPLVTLGAVGR